MAIRARGSLDKHFSAAFQLPALPLLPSPTGSSPLPFSPSSLEHAKAHTHHARAHQRPFAPAAPSACTLPSQLRDPFL